jgi:energy-coupling factor transporter ATP-binding protein EcfA2
MADDTYDVFVSYSRADRRHATEIDSILRDKGLKTFFDRRNLAAGLPWVRALEQAIGGAKAAIVLIGPRGLGNTQQYERDLAFVRQTRDSAFPIVPVILPETTTDPPFDFLRVLTWIDFSHVTRVSDAPDALEQLLAAVRGGGTPGEAAREAICPYRGLDAFREEDSAFFFGRGNADDPESAIGQLVRKVREHPFVMVVGRSGSGKSSLVYAGLLSALRREPDRFWDVLSMRPGPTPLRALAAAFNPRAENEGAAEYATKITDEADKLRTGDLELLSHMIREQLDLAEGKPDRLLLYIDQWEELYAQAPSSSDKQRAAQHAADVKRFIDLLLTAAQTAPVAVVGTVRADFYDPLIGHQEIKSLLLTRQVLLGKMLRSELEQTIMEPAKKVKLIFDPPSLVQRILDEAGEDDGMLPLLQYALKETWARRQGNRLTGDSYAQSGGVREAIRITAEQTFDALSPADQQVARQLFLRLVTPGEGQEDTRARAAMPVDQAQRKIVEQFAAQRTRLLVTGFDRAARPTVEVAHEALIRTWPRLREWIDSNREKLRARAAVLQAKTDWEKSDSRDDMLLPAGLQLERARTLLIDPGDITTDDIKEFVSLSSAREKADRAAKEKQLRFQRRVSMGAVTAAVLMSIIGGFAWVQWGEANTSKIMAQAERDKATTSRDEARVARDEADQAKIIAEGERDKATAARDEATRSERRTLQEKDRADAELKKAQTAQSLFLANSARQQRSEGDVGTAALLALEALASAVGNDRPYVPEAETQLVGAWRDLRERLVLTAHGKKLDNMFMREGKNLGSAVFSPDGRRIVAPDNKTARVWDAGTGKQIGEPLTGHMDSVTSAAFSPDGKRIVTASGDKTVRLWDAETGKQIGEPLIGHTESVLSAAFSPDGKRIVTASVDKTARLWDAETGKQIGEPLTGHTGSVNSAAFSPDGKRIVTASGDKTARVWKIFANTQELVSQAKAAVPRCLTSELRKAFFLPPEPLQWCIELEKWPYHTGIWKQWLSGTRAGKGPPLPGSPPPKNLLAPSVLIAPW